MKKYFILVSYLFFNCSLYGLTEDEKNTIDIFKRDSGSVVFIKNIKIAYNFFLDPMAVPRGAGSGFIWDKEGHIVTNYHVVENGDKFIVTLKNQKQYDAKLIGGEPRKDVAVLKLKERVDNLVPLEVGSSKSLLVGQKAIAIGNPFGLDNSMTTGIISALDREIQGFGGVKIRGMIQTDAAINQGNSGGPLMDSDGKLIGMNTMIYSPSGASAGIGFAVPVEIIKSAVPQIIKHGKVIQPGLGISVLPDGFLYRLGIKGVGIRSVEKGTPAAKAGLKGIREDSFGRFILGDVITGINGKRIESYDDLYSTLDTLKVGDYITVDVLRNDNKITKKLRLIAL